MGFFDKLKAGLAKTKNAVFGQLNEVVKNFRRVDEDLLEELEEIMIMADMGAATTEKVIDELRDRVKTKNIKDAEQVKYELADILRAQVGEGEPLDLSTSPSVILVIGVNGVGKTTSIGKIANNLRESGKKVIVAAADTFRAAAIEQLAVWCDRAGVELIAQKEGADPASVVFDAIAAANKRKADVLIIDTAGRLHNKSNLMDELAKINRIISRELPDAARETLLVLDATTGQNAVMQAKKFKEAADITGLVLTKLDGTAKGGAVFSIKDEIDLPVKFIGVGEQIDDMQPFDAKMFVDALISDEVYTEEPENDAEDGEEE
ncbi:MAG: signal recognition particle-docking protein FtsY [Clostridia bacterium]|nr:signal recognition particle-docking protein FtsY [Clostridia bacterium]